MKPHRYAIKVLLAIVAILCLCQCTVVQKKTDAAGVTTTTGISLATDADAMVIDGPLPVATGTIPITNKSGKIIGYRPTYGAGPAGGEHALYAAFGQDQSKGFGKACNAATYGVGTLAAAGVTKARDASDAATAQKGVEAGTQQAAIAADVAKNSSDNAVKMAAIGGKP